MNCRKCGACCTAPSISSPIPDMPEGKPAGFTCIHITQDNECSIYEKRPAVCRNYTPTADLCGNSKEEALKNLKNLEELTRA